MLPRWLVAEYFRGARCWLRHVGYDPYETLASVEALLAD